MASFASNMKTLRDYINVPPRNGWKKYDWSGLNATGSISPADLNEQLFEKIVDKMKISTKIKEQIIDQIKDKIVDGVLDAVFGEGTPIGLAVKAGNYTIGALKVITFYGFAAVDQPGMNRYDPDRDMDTYIEYLLWWYGRGDWRYKAPKKEWL
jgi:hypothetical protein